jgi:hypothetical protein
MHYEGQIENKGSSDDFIQYTAALATYDIQIGEQIIDVVTTGYYQTLTYEEEGAMVSNIWGYIDSPYAFIDVYLMNPNGETFTEATYSGTDYIYDSLEFDGAIETDEMGDFFMEENTGTITFSKTATTMTFTFTEVPMYFDEEMILNGTVTYDIAAPLAAAAPAKNIPNKIKNLGKQSVRQSK